MITCAAGLYELTTGFVQVLGEREVANGRAPRRGAACRAGCSGSALVRAEAVAGNFYPVLMLLI
ncbi:hypothetical protein D3C81_1661430 [compost metagenome]